MNFIEITMISWGIVTTIILVVGWRHLQKN